MCLLLPGGLTFATITKRDGKAASTLRLLGVFPEAADTCYNFIGKDSYLVIEPGRLYLGRARAIRVTMAPCPLGREQPLRVGTITVMMVPLAVQDLH